MAMNIASLSSTLSPNVASRMAELARTNAMHYNALGTLEGADQNDAMGGDALSLAALGQGARPARVGVQGVAKGSGSFENALLKAMDGVSSSQNNSDDLLQRVVADPNSVDAQDVTIAMAEANMSLNLAKTVLSRVVTAWKDIINTR